MAMRNVVDKDGFHILLKDPAPGVDNNVRRRLAEQVQAWRDEVIRLMDQIAHATSHDAPVTWPTAPGWYWAFGRIAGMPEPTLMAAFAAVEGNRMIVYIGEAMTHRLSLPDPELPLQFELAVLPKFNV